MQVGATIFSEEGYVRVTQIYVEVEYGVSRETLRPNAAGDETAIPTQYPDSTYHWDKVDEVEADDDTTYVSSVDSGAWQRDLYNLPAHSVGSGTISKITIHLRIYYGNIDDYAKACLKTGGTVYESGNLPRTVSAWKSASWEQATNPKTGVAWTWDDIDALQVGATIFSEGGHVRVTQIYVEVEYGASSYSQHIMLWG